MPTYPGFAYQQAGVDTDQASTGLKGLLHWVRQTHALRQDVGTVRLPIGYYANVIDIGHGLGLAISTDGVGSKLLVAQLMDQYDTVGIDCVAMNERYPMRRRPTAVLGRLLGGAGARGTPPGATGEGVV